MYARVVKFKDVSRETVDNVVDEIEASGGPPEGVAATGVRMLYDAEQGTSYFVSFYDSAEDMRAADAVFDAMDPHGTPGSRVSVDMCEVVMDREMD
jgi:hypothetical protein